MEDEISKRFKKNKDRFINSLLNHCSIDIEAQHRTIGIQDISNILSNELTPPKELFEELLKTKRLFPMANNTLEIIILRYHSLILPNLPHKRL